MELVPGHLVAIKKVHGDGVWVARVVSQDEVGLVELETKNGFVFALPDTELSPLDTHHLTHYVAERTFHCDE